MPAAPYELDTALKEGVKFEFLTNPVSIIQKDGVVKGVRCGKMKLGEPDKSGRRSPIEIEGSDFDIQCDSFIMAVGQVPDFDFLKDTPDIKTNKGKTIAADEFTHMTDMQGVFAGGDALTGPMSIVDSNRDGKNAARRIDQYIRTGSFEATDDCLFEYLFEKIGVYDKKEMVDYTDFPKGNLAAEPVEEPVEARISNFMEADKGLTSDDVVYEATRCMRCYFLMLVKFED
jgi:formate dehydrogenase beta subunit